MSTITTRAGRGRYLPRRLVSAVAATVLCGAGLVALAGTAQAAGLFVVTSLSPSSGPTSGGTVVTITGSGFLGGGSCDPVK